MASGWSARFLGGTLAWKLARIVAAVVLLFALQEAFYILPVFRARLLEHRRATCRAVVEVAHGILAHHQRLEQAARLSPEEARRQAVACLRELRYEDGNYLWINDLTPTMVMHPTRPDLEGKPLADQRDAQGRAYFLEFVKVAQEHGEGFVEYTFAKPGSPDAQPKLSCVKAFPAWGWIVGSGTYLDDLNREMRVLALVLAAGVAISALLAWLLARPLLRRLRSAFATLNTTMAEVSHGNLAVEVPPMGTDELGAIGAELATLVDGMRRSLREVTQASESAASGAAQLAATGSEQIRAAEDVAQGASRLLQGSEVMAQEIRFLNASLVEVADNVSRIQSQVSRAVKAAERGQSAGGATERAMGDIQAVTSQIVSATQLIAEIAKQTNLLSLNAAIEAAKAGSQGKGFAVVADEIRKLAERSAAAAKDIAEMIGRTHSAVEQGLVTVEETVTVLAGIRQDISALTGMVEEIDSVASQDQERADVIRRQVEATSADAQRNASTAEELSAGTEQVASTAGELARVAETLASTVRRFRL